MRLPTWESSAGALLAFLNSTTQCFMADLFTITLSGGTVLRYTASDVPVTINGNTFAVGPVIKRGRTKLTVGISVDTLDVSISADSTVTVNGVPILQFIAGGGFDAASVLLERAFTSAPGAAWIGTVGLFAGRIGPGTTSRYEATLTVNSDSELLNTMVPRNVYQPGCSNTLFDAACGLVKSTFASSAAASSATDATGRTFSTAMGQASGYFAQGWAVGLTGPNAGVGRTIKTFDGGVVTTIQPWPSAVAIGNTFTVYPGCDKQQATCRGKFANLARFRGQPYVPAPETIT
jgi:uncharacterized phage protein (TIGR02218 family)